MRNDFWKTDHCDEWCPECEAEVELPWEFKVHICPNCGRPILPCSICEMGVYECSDCPLEEQRQKLEKELGLS